MTLMLCDNDGIIFLKIYYSICEQTIIISVSLCILVA